MTSHVIKQRVMLTWRLQFGIVVTVFSYKVTYCRRALYVNVLCCVSDWTYEVVTVLLLHLRLMLRSSYQQRPLQQQQQRCTAGLFTKEWNITKFKYGRQIVHSKSNSHYRFNVNRLKVKVISDSWWMNVFNLGGNVVLSTMWCACGTYKQSWV